MKGSDEQLNKEKCRVRSRRILSPSELVLWNWGAHGTMDQPRSFLTPVVQEFLWRLPLYRHACLNHWPPVVKLNLHSSSPHWKLGDGTEFSTFLTKAFLSGEQPPP